MKALHGLEKWGLNEAEVATAGTLARVSIHLAYPSYQLLMAYPPAARRRRVAAMLRQEQAALKALLPDVPSVRIGSAIRPKGLGAQLPLNRLPGLLAEPAIANIFIEEIEGRSRISPPVELSFWSIKARFAIQVEQARGGLQTFEDRILLIKATDEADAQRRLLPTFDDYAKPYLNSAGYLVRWQFERFLDAYEVGVASLDQLLRDGYLEVFSEMGRRKLVPTTEWHPTL